MSLLKICLQSREAYRIVKDFSNSRVNVVILFVSNQDVDALYVTCADELLDEN